MLKPTHHPLQFFFARFIRSRGIHRHYHRRSMLETLGGTTHERQVQANHAQVLRQAAVATPQTVLDSLHTTDQGLSAQQADRVRAQVGGNDIEQEKPQPWWLLLWHCYRTPFDLLLSLLAVVSFLTGDLRATAVISAMVCLSVSLRFVQELKSHRAADQLKALVSNKAMVLRPDQSPQDIPVRDLVPGDVISLSAGDMIPADCRVLQAKDLFVAQAAMTGESLPVEKFAHDADAHLRSPMDLDNIVFMGTNVVSGTAHVVVVATGQRSYFGDLAMRLTQTDRAPTQFQAGVNKVAWLLIRFMMVMVPLVLLVNGLTKGNWVEAALFALSIAVGLTPEMLPMIVTSTLAKGAVRLSQQKVVVKRLDAIQNFGAMDVLCTDKTGTLTQDKIVLARHTDVWGQTSRDVLEYAYLNSYYQTGLKNMLDVAVLDQVQLHHDLEVATAYAKVDEVPFDFQRRRMSVVVIEHDLRHLLICKGALEEVMKVCNRVRRDGQDLPLTPDLLADIQHITHGLNEEGLRVVAVAVKETDTSQTRYSVADESELTLVGYVAFLDPPKDTTAAALHSLNKQGVSVMVLTGDNEWVTRKVCHDVGLPIVGLLNGADIQDMSDAQLAAALPTHNVFAKLTPDHKERVVRQLRASGHVVGFMGDGINDAPALRAADIGISVDTAVDIAKEAADIILLEKSLMVLSLGVKQGRRTFANMLKYIKMTASSNFGNVLSVLVASAALPFLPMLPMHLLVQNLLYDISQIGIHFDNVDASQVAAPQKWNPQDLGRFMLFFGPISSIFDLTTFALMWWVFGANVPEKQTLFQSGWFVVGLLTQTLVVHMVRTQYIPFVQSRASTPLIVMTVCIMLLGIALPMGPLAAYFKLQALPAAYFPYLGLILLGYVTLTQLMKRFYTRRFGWQ